MQKNPWKVLTSRVVYQNPWITVREDQVIRPDGNPGIYGVVELPESVGIVALNQEGLVALVGQWRYTHNRYSWEIPTGGSASTDGTVLDAAKRELEEEVGASATDWINLGWIDNSNGATNDVAHLFLAKRLVLGETRPEATEAIITRWVPLDEAVRMVMEGEITESCSVAGILKAERILSSTQP